MRINSKVPKTFSIFIKKDDKSGFLKLHSSQESNGDITYYILFAKNISDASKFVNFDNAKKKAVKFGKTHNFDEVKVVDDKLMKYYYVKKATSKQ